MIQEIWAAARSLARRPGQTALTGAILTLGLTAGLATFTYVNGYYQAFPGIDPRGLVRLFAQEADNPYLDIPFLDYLDYAKADGAFAEIAAAQAGYAASVRHESMTEVAFLEAVSQGYFSVLGIDVALGRGLTAADDRPEAQPVAVLSYSWWQRSFGGQPSVLGQTLYLNYRPFTIVGVMRPDFVGATSGFRPDVWIPIAPFRDRYVSWARLAEDRDTPLVRVYGRLRPGSGRSAALAELESVARNLDAAYPRPERMRELRLETATWIDPRARQAELPTIRVMTIGAAGLLLLVCANVANLLLSLATARQREAALRAALGASPARLVRLLLTENVLLSTVAGLAALYLAGPASTRLGSYFARPSVWGDNVPREVSFDLRVVVFAIGVSVLTGLVAGLLPALRAARRDLVVALKSDSAAAIGEARTRAWRPRAQDLLVATQVALSVVLLVVAGLVLRTLSAVSERDPGFVYQSMVASTISTSSTDLQPEQREGFLRELTERLTEESWVRSVALTGNAPLSGHPVTPVGIDGLPEPVPLVVARATPGYHETLGIELLRGRGFEPGDVAGALDVAVVSQSLADRYFVGQDPLGKSVWFPEADGRPGRRFEIVGVTRDVKLRDFLADPEPVLFLSYSQQGYGTTSALAIDTSIDPGVSIPLLYRWLREFEPHLAIINVLPYTEVIRGFLYTQRMNAEMFSALAILGLSLATIGVFSVMSLAVGRRTREIGVRMALGASRSDVGRLVLRRALAPVAVGIAIGLAGAFAIRGLVGNLLEGVGASDPVSLVAGSAILVAGALAAAYLPARRAASVDPAIALRGGR